MNSPLPSIESTPELRATLKFRSFAHPGFATLPVYLQAAFNALTHIVPGPKAFLTDLGTILTANQVLHETGRDSQQEIHIHAVTLRGIDPRVKAFVRLLEVLEFDEARGMVIAPAIAPPEVQLFFKAYAAAFATKTATLPPNIPTVVHYA